MKKETSNEKQNKGDYVVASEERGEALNIFGAVEEKAKYRHKEKGVENGGQNRADGKAPEIVFCHLFNSCREKSCKETCKNSGGNANQKGIKDVHTKKGGSKGGIAEALNKTDHSENSAQDCAGRGAVKTGANRNGYHGKGDFQTKGPDGQEGNDADKGREKA